MANTIKIKNSGTTGTAPSALEFGELGLNYADGKIFFKNLSSSIVEFQTPPNLVVQPTAPANTSVIWADTSVTGVGVVPTGGTTGQVLSKASNTNYDAAWANTVTSSDLALKANIASPTFTGTVTIPAGASISGFAPIASPSLTGTPTAPTAAAGTNTTQIATMASKPWNTAWGFVAQSTLAAGTGYITPTTDLLSITFTAVANRRYRYFATGLIVSDGIGPSSTNFTDNNNVVIREYYTYFAVGNGSNYQTGIIDYVETAASSGSVTRKIRHNSSSMGVYYYGAAVRDSIAWKLSVEDIGPA